MPEKHKKYCLAQPYYKLPPDGSCFASERRYVQMDVGENTDIGGIERLSNY